VTVNIVADSDLQNKLAAARTRLILDKPFLGALVLRLPLVAADPKWCQGAATDAKKLYYNQDYINALDIKQTQFVLAKQALHCALSHFARRQHRIKHRWDLACDYAVNQLLINDGLKAPPETLVDDGYEGMTAEEIYHYIGDLDNEDSELEKQSEDPPDDQDNPNQKVVISSPQVAILIKIHNNHRMQTQMIIVVRKEG